MHDLVSIDAGELSTRELNIKLNELVEGTENIEIIAIFLLCVSKLVIEFILFTNIS